MPVCVNTFHFTMDVYLVQTGVTVLSNRYEVTGFHMWMLWVLSLSAAPTVGFRVNSVGYLHFHSMFSGAVNTYSTSF